ncbi:GFA family protein [Natronospira bacteriovora]|uniref:GFA family protein n=1 Tax=Natronospira bacteriovora TaxID=3069753 RepID=A0ABU0W4V1_9GAMM|nr:GFA family protein [Natronospira sp. AB-CW4]MDQ2068984.1 GFA family protein [Natronospira sp. AB-CW4]
MKLEGSCHCGAVRFTCESRAPYPFMHCYCSICRKLVGGGGFAINLHADANSLSIEGEEHISVYRAWMNHPTRSQRSEGERRFCRHCGSMLWVQDPNWPELMHPFASAIDTPLPEPPERIHMMLDSKPAWVPVPHGEYDRHFDGYPDESLEAWHQRHGLLMD